MQLLRIVTRTSALAMVQAAMVVERIEAASAERCQIIGITTRGDKALDKSLTQIGGDGVFVKELERALLDERADVAVHSLKDLPTDIDPRLNAGAVLERGDPRDVLVSAGNAYPSIAGLPLRAVLGTSSLRRRSQLGAQRPDLRIEDLRGNVHTRVRKVLEGSYDCAVLAYAGLERAGLLSTVGGGSVLPVAEMVPAVGQGALFAQCRRGDVRALRALKPLNDSATAQAVAAERAFLRRMGGGCAVPVGCYVRVDAGGWTLDAFAGSPDGRAAVRRRCCGSQSDATQLSVRAEAVASEMLASGAAALIAQFKVGGATA